MTPSAQNHREHAPGKVRVRFAPSPTGPLHVGGARTALVNWLFARKSGGEFILRIEDTDKARSEKKYEEAIVEGLSWLGLKWDEEPQRQSERGEIYKKYLEELIAKGDAYYCYCTKEELEAQRDAMASQGLSPKYSGRCRSLKEPPPGRKPEVIRFKVPDVVVEFNDLIRGKMSFDASLFGDMVIAKDLTAPLYNFTVVVDDELMDISHVIRGEEHLANTPKQVIVQRALGFREPIYAHIPLILNADRTKMSKRFSDTALATYRERGYLPGAIVNFLALLGWHPKGDREIFSTEELVREFDLYRMQSAGAIWNEEKLNWLNREHMKQLDDEEIADELKPFIERAGFSNRIEDKAFMERIVAVERPRAHTLMDFIEGGRFFLDLPKYESGLLIWKDGTHDAALTALRAVQTAIRKINAGDFAREELESAVGEAIAAADGKRGAVLWPLRVALSGLRASPDPIEIMEVLGKDESLARIDGAIKKLDAPLL